MRLVFCLMFFINLGYGQADIRIADQYFENGEFEKALVSYKALLKENPTGFGLSEKLAKTHQELEQYAEAKTVLTNLMQYTTSPKIVIALGYNEQLQGNTAEAESYYNQALKYLDKNPRYAYVLGSTFHSLVLLDYAAKSYEQAMEMDPQLELNLQLAKIYGEQGKIEEMFTKILASIEFKPDVIPMAKRQLSDFISENSANSNNTILRKLLLQVNQAAPSIIWNDMLSWLFVQQGDYQKAFAQEKVIYKRYPANFNRITNLGLTTRKANAIEVSKSIFEYIYINTKNTDEKLNAKYTLLDMEIETASKSEYKRIEDEFQTLLKNFNGIQTLKLEVLYAHFLAFYQDKKEEGITLLKTKLEEQNLTRFQLATVKLELADILVLQERFNEALIYYTQIQNSLKNSTISQQARFKVAKTSYYKGDFDWAESQLKILKSSTSQLIANDALELKLLISDNKFEDSLQTALKRYAKADLLAFQNKPYEAISELNSIISDFKTETIVDQALFMQAKLFEKTEQLDQAERNYKTIINNFKDDILIDDAYYFLAQLYEKQGLLEEAKPFYEQLIFNHEDSIYFVEARKRFRSLRGDTIKL